MSYDTDIIIPACECCGRDEERIDIGNMTSNVGRMFYAVMPGPYEGGGRYSGNGEPDPERGGLPGISGLKCSDALPILDAGVESMIAREAEMRAIEPANKWGTFDGALDYLCDIRRGCRKNPKGIVAVSW